MLIQIIIILIILCILRIQFRSSHTNSGHEIIVEEQLR